MIGIYSITNKVNGKRYIGKSSSIEDRTASIYRNKRLDSAIKHYGEHNFEVEILEECSISELDDRERYWIQYYHTYIHDPNCHGYNMTLGGDGVDSLSASLYNKEYWNREGVRESRSGKNHHFYGKHHTEESRELQKISAHSRPPASEETREKHRTRMLLNNPMRDSEIAKKNADSRRGKSLSEEHRKNIGLAGKGRKAWNAGLKLGPQSPELIAKRAAAMIGHEVSDECRENIRLSKSGCIAINNGVSVKYVRESELSQYEQLGYKRGVLPYRKRREYHLICKSCGKDFIGNSSTIKLCPDCKISK